MLLHKVFIDLTIYLTKQIDKVDKESTAANTDVPDIHSIAIPHQRNDPTYHADDKKGYKNPK